MLEILLRTLSGPFGPNDVTFGPPLCGLTDVHVIVVSRLALVALGLLALLAANTVHEFGHAWVADRLGDPTPRAQGRVTLSPRAHLQALGFWMLVATSLIGLPLGWGKPVRTNPEAYTRCSPRLGIALVSLGGPLANLLFALLLAPIARPLLGRILDDPESAGPALVFGFFGVAIAMLVSLSLALFNLLPLAPLDGARIVASLLPEAWGETFQKVMGRVGPYVLLALLYSGVIGQTLGPVVLRLFLWLIGL